MTSIIEINNLSKKYNQNKNLNVLKNLNFKFKKGKIYSLTGPSGSGKSTLLNILSLIILVAAFNIISGLTIFVKNKTREIAILKSIGVQNRSIQKIFFIVGFSIGSLATMCGILLGVLFSVYIENIRKFLSHIFNLSLFPEEIYFLSKMPSEINITSILIISIISILITCIVSIFPASKASNLDPAKALKYD